MILAIYLFIIIWLFRKRHEYPVYNRSPKLIIVGAIGMLPLCFINILFLLGLLLDSLTNVFISMTNMKQL